MKSTQNSGLLESWRRTVRYMRTTVSQQPVTFNIEQYLQYEVESS